MFDLVLYCIIVAAVHVMLLYTVSGKKVTPCVLFYNSGK